MYALDSLGDEGVEHPEVRRQPHRGGDQPKLRVAPLNLDALSESWRLTLKHHIYVADALQISTATHAEANIFLSSDKHLNEIAEAEGLKTTNDEET